MNLIADIKDFFQDKKKPLLVLLGPTASGKTALSLKLAKEFDGEIISTDSRQIYRGMRIATDVLPEKERMGIVHHMLEIADPKEVISLREYVDMVRKLIDELQMQKKVPILVGGTGLYISAILEGYDVPRVKPNLELRDKLYKEAGELGNDHLHSRLADIDPEAAAEIHPNNLPYVVRALEINLLSGLNKKANKDISTVSEGSNRKFVDDAFLVGINWPRETLYDRIGMRVDRQIERGLVNEVKNLMEKNLNVELPAMTALGVKEIIPYLRGEMSLNESVEILKMNTRRYAKRQLTWFRRYGNVTWISPTDLILLTESA